MNKELQEAAEKARREINEQLEAFVAKLEQLNDGDIDPMTFTEMQMEWRQLSQKTKSIYADLAASARDTLESAGKLKHE